MTIDEDKRVTITLKVMEVLSSWGLTSSQQAEILAMPSNVRSRHMHQYKEGVPLPLSDEIDVRVDHILGISDALRTSYPLNFEMGAYWMKQASAKRFNNRAPISCIIEDGLEGLIAVRVHLDCAYDWHIDKLQHKNK